jgi:hypothetical protein
MQPPRTGEKKVPKILLLNGRRITLPLFDQMTRRRSLLLQKRPQI